MTGRRGWTVAGPVLWAAGVPVACLLLATGGALAGEHLSPAGVGSAVESVLWPLAGAIVMITQLRYQNAIAFLGAGIGLAAGILLFPHSVAEEARDSRGETVDCVILDVSRETRSDGDTTRTEYRHRLDCPAPGPATITTGRPLGTPGERVRIVRDPEQRFGPSPAGPQLFGDPHRSRLVGGAAFLAGIVLRVLYELEVLPGPDTPRRFRIVRSRWARR